jgi:L-lactate dehydrogenase complex protein LldG
MTTPAVLQHVRERLRQSNASAAGRMAAAHAPVAVSHAERHDRPPAGTVVGTPAERFASALRALAGHVHEAEDGAAVASIVIDICRERGADVVLAWADVSLGVPGFAAALQAAGIKSDGGWLPDAAGERTRRLNDLGTVLVGVTGASAGIAETGTVAVVSGPGQSRLASLLPPIHVAVLPLSRLHETIAEFFSSRSCISEDGSNLVLITGPSRTADIEMTLTRGVHGPGEVHVILVRG